MEKIETRGAKKKAIEDKKVMVWATVKGRHREEVQALITKIANRYNNKK